MRITRRAAGTALVARVACTRRAFAGITIPREVLAFYYGWWGTPETTGTWQHWNVDNGRHVANVTHQPLGGPYDSLDPGRVRAQASLARQAGLTGFIVSWWGQDSFTDASLAVLLEAAGAEGLKVCAYLEKLDGEDEFTRVDAALSDLLYLLRVHASNPAWLTVAGKPTFFIYGRAGWALPITSWQTVFQRVRQSYPIGIFTIGPAVTPYWDRAYDGVHQYTTTVETQGMRTSELLAWATAHYKEVVSSAGDRISCATIIPGYDDSHLDRPLPHAITDRAEGRNYDAVWTAAIAAQPDWVLITSWNEWHEGSEIEPSVGEGSRYIDETRVMAAKFKALLPRTRRFE